MADEHDCGYILARTYEFLDHELDPAQEDVIRAHLMACEPCLDHFDIEEAVKALVKRCCSQEKAPDALRMRIVAHYSSTTFVVREP